MGKYNKVFVLFALVMFPALLSAQFNNNTSSPYSRYGLGELHPYSFGRSTALGGASIASRNNEQINLANPASFDAVDSLGFMFEFAVNAKSVQFADNIGKVTANDVNFQYFAMNFQINNRLGTSMGLVPFSDVGYSVVIDQDIENTGPVRTTYYGAGTISNVFLGAAYQPFKFLSVGANLNYYFGLLNRNAEVVFLGASDFYNMQQYKSLRISDFSFDYGLQATIPLKERNKIVLGAVFENNPRYNAFFSDITQKNLASGSTVDQDTLYYIEESKGVIEFPFTYGLGISYVKENKLEINADYYHQPWGEAKFLGTKSNFLTDLNKFAIGAEWIPDKFSIKSYTSRIAYRAGVRYEQTYLIFNNRQITDFGITFGVGLPVYRSKSTINVAAELGKKGTKEENLVQENYFRLNLMVNLYDLWFIKRRFD
ncbi:MAG: hypothetical protein FD181_1572 [Prolixibacteraceae bacterium]|nr:MAG: hypothetical protein FD181_1572 [Prolixibacteraceae bacterium]